MAGQSTLPRDERPINERLRDLRANVLDLQSVLESVRKGEASIKTYSQYLVETRDSIWAFVVNVEREKSTANVTTNVDDKIIDKSQKVGSDLLNNMAATKSLSVERNTIRSSSTFTDDADSIQHLCNACKQITTNT